MVLMNIKNKLSNSYTLILSLMSKLILTLTLGLAFSTSVSASTLNIFTCEPEYAALAKELTPENTNIFSATTAMQDPHFIQARPSLIAKMRRADLVVCAGASLEAGWLPLLLKKSNNRKVQSIDKGLFLASEHIENLDIPERTDRSQGDVHEEGNPHVHLDPKRILTLPNALKNTLIQISPQNRHVFEERHAHFKTRWIQAISTWQQQAKPLQGLKVISYHSSFRYLFEFLSIEKAGDLEPVPGLPPTTAHLNTLLKTVKAQHVPVVVYTGYQQDKAALWLADKAEIKALQLPYTIGGNTEADDLFSLMDSHISLLLSTLNR